MDWNKELYRLQFIIRYSNVPRVRDENVAQHSFFVSTICLELLQEFPGIDAEKVLTMAIIHDWPEAKIDDVAHDVKRDYPSIKKALKQAELKVMNQYPRYLQKIFQEYEEGLTLEAQLVKIADTKQCVQYLKTEVELGNRFMEPLLKESEELLFQLYKRISILNNIKGADKNFGDDLQISGI